MYSQFVDRPIPPMTGSYCLLRRFIETIAEQPRRISRNDSEIRHILCNRGTCPYNRAQTDASTLRRDNHPFSDPSIMFDSQRSAGNVVFSNHAQRRIIEKRVYGQPIEGMISQKYPHVGADRNISTNARSRWK